MQTFLRPAHERGAGTRDVPRRLKLNEAALAGCEWWDREISLNEKQNWLSGKRQEQSSPSLPLFCYYSNLKSLRAPLAFLLRLNSLSFPFLTSVCHASLPCRRSYVLPHERGVGTRDVPRRLKLNEAALAGCEWWDREISLNEKQNWLSGKRQEQSSPSLPLFCYYSNLKSLLFCCFVIDVYNGLLKSRVTNALRRTPAWFTLPLFALILIAWMVELWFEQVRFLRRLRIL